jgi:alpha-tubulin suppressor-like RCC1 family protein
MCTDPAGSFRSLTALALAALAVSACTEPPTLEDRSAVMRWLKCEECVHNELAAVRKAGNRAVPLLSEALQGPPSDSTANVQRQIGEAYVRIRERGPVPALDSARYANHYLRNYRSLYQSRAITGLAAIGTSAAIAALEAARDSADSGVAAFQFRADVRDELDQALAGRWSSISAGLGRTCGIRMDGSGYCWGKNDQGQLGDGGTTASSRPVGIHPPHGTDTPLRFITIAVGDSGQHTCGISVDKRAFCWGDNAQGQLGDNSITEHHIPTAVDTGLALVGIVVGGNHTCGWTPDYRTLCWGDNGFGQLGDGTTTDRRIPTAVGSNLAAVRVSAGANHTCADSLNNVLYCWGLNGDGQLGDGGNTNRPLPSKASTAIRVKALSVGAVHTCVLAQAGPGVDEGSVYCAGNNSDGQLGDGSTTDRNELTKTDGPLFLSVSAGENHTCAIAANTRQVYCWGSNQFGQLGTGVPAGATLPTPVSGPLAFLAVSAGAGHTCGITIQGQAFCWGLNSDGQLGDSTTTNQPTPVRVVMIQP